MNREPWLCSTMARTWWDFKTQNCQFHWKHGHELWISIKYECVALGNLVFNQSLGKTFSGTRLDQSNLEAGFQKECGIDRPSHLLLRTSHLSPVRYVVKPWGSSQLLPVFRVVLFPLGLALEGSPHWYNNHGTSNSLKGLWDEVVTMIMTPQKSDQPRYAVKPCPTKTVTIQYLAVRIGTVSLIL